MKCLPTSQICYRCKFINLVLSTLQGCNLFVSHVSFRDQLACEQAPEWGYATEAVSEASGRAGPPYSLSGSALPLASFTFAARFALVTPLGSLFAGYDLFIPLNDAFS